MRVNLLERLGGHFHTIAPFARHVLRPGRVPPSRPWQIALADPVHGRVSLTGRLHTLPGAKRILLVVHGLGGSADSHYVGAAVRAAVDAGMACLRINLRGADRSGDDFYHAGLSSDLASVVESLGDYAAIHVLGYSLGGHVSLRLATETRDPCVRSVAAICSPLDLDRCAHEIDRMASYVYRRHVLIGLREMYAAYAARRSAIIPLAEATRIGTIREWDDRIVARRHGFDDVSHYYAEASVAPRLRRLRVPALLVASEHDPMVPAHTVRPALTAASRLDVRWIRRGGHVGFPAEVSLGLPGPAGLEAQVVAWLQENQADLPG